MLILIDEVLIPALEGLINAVVRALQSRLFWGVVACLAVVVVVVRVVTGLSWGDVMAWDHVSTLWGLIGDGDAPGDEGVSPAEPGDRYRGGATPSGVQD